MKGVKINTNQKSICRCLFSSTVNQLAGVSNKILCIDRQKRDAQIWVIDKNILLNPYLVEKINNSDVKDV